MVDYRTRSEWQEEVLPLTGGRGVDHIVEVGGGGRIHMIGVLSQGTLDPLTLIQ